MGLTTTVLRTTEKSRRALLRALDGKEIYDEEKTFIINILYDFCSFFRGWMWTFNIRPQHTRIRE